jgi:hypothetical protein
MNVGSSSSANRSLQRASERDKSGRAPVGRTGAHVADQAQVGSVGRLLGHVTTLPQRNGEQCTDCRQEQAGKCVEGSLASAAKVDAADEACNNFVQIRVRRAVADAHVACVNLGGLPKHDQRRHVAPAGQLHVVQAEDAIVQVEAKVRERDRAARPVDLDAHVRAHIHQRVQSFVAAQRDFERELRGVTGYGP